VLAGIAGGGCSLSPRMSSESKYEGFNAFCNRVKDGIESRVIQHGVYNLIFVAEHFRQEEDAIVRYTTIRQSLKMIVGHAESDGPIIMPKVTVPSSRGKSTSSRCRG